MTAAGMVPPCDLEAEGALCAACLIAPRRAPDVLAALDPRDCYSGANRAILDAVRQLHDAGEPVDVLTVRSRLNGSVPAEYLAQLMGSAPTIENLDAYGAIVSGKARQRRTIARLQQLAAEGYAAADADAWLAEVAASLPEAGPRRRGIEWLGADGIFCEHPEPEWIVPDLCIGPGRASCIASYAGIGKTLVAQDIALAVASGGLAFGHMRVRKGRVRHVDRDQGRATMRRYWRLARGRGLRMGDVAGRIEVALFPNLTLTDSSDALWLDVCGGWDLVILDSMRGLVPGAEENSSDIQALLLRLAGFSFSTGCTFLILHHFGKTPLGGGKQDLERLRGSSGIGAGLGAVFTMTGKKDEARLVTHVKAHEDASCGLHDDFHLELSEGSDGLLPRPWILRYKTPEQIDPPVSRQDRLDRVADDLAAWLVSHPASSARSMRALCSCDTHLIPAALEQLERQGKAARSSGGRGGGARWSVCDPPGGDS